MPRQQIDNRGQIIRLVCEYMLYPQIIDRYECMIEQRNAMENVHDRRLLTNLTSPKHRVSGQTCDSQSNPISSSRTPSFSLARPSPPSQPDLLSHVGVDGGSGASLGEGGQHRPLVPPRGGSLQPTYRGEEERQSESDRRLQNPRRRPGPRSYQARHRKTGKNYARSLNMSTDGENYLLYIIL